ncbi:MAG TPA: hypothetical protein VH643_28260 [Gemmataceae bacterium]|jgi:hypothetical protein
MSNEQQKDVPAREVPQAVEKMIDAMVGQALARCERLGIAQEDYYRAFVEEQRLHPKASVSELFDLAFRRLEGGSN